MGEAAWVLAIVVFFVRAGMRGPAASASVPSYRDESRFSHAVQNASEGIFYPNFLPDVACNRRHARGFTRRFTRSFTRQLHTTASHAPFTRSFTRSVTRSLGDGNAPARNLRRTPRDVRQKACTL